MFNPGALFQQVAGKNPKLLGILGECWQVAQGIQKSRQGILDYLNKNNAMIRDMLPYLQQGNQVRSILDSVLPKGMTSRIQTFGEDLMKEQESGKQQTSSTAAPNSQHGAMGNRFPPLKQKR